MYVVRFKCLIPNSNLKSTLFILPNTHKLQVHTKICNALSMCTLNVQFEKDKISL